MKKSAAAERSSGPNVAPPQANDRISLNAAARESGYNRNGLRAAVDDGRIRCIERQPWGDSDRIYVSRSELVADLAQLPPCKAAGCETLALAASGYCGDHFGESGRDRAVVAELDVLANGRDWYLASEAARVAGVSLTTLNLDVQSGLLRSEKIGRHRRVTRGALREYRRLKASQPRPKTTSAEEREARKARVIELDRQGLTHAQIAAKLHCDVHTVIADLDRSGAERKRRARPRTLAAEQLAQLPALYEAGETLDKLATRFEVSPGHVRDVLERLGVQRRPAGTCPKHPPATEHVCEQCGARFTPKHRGRDRRFCTLKCANDWQAEQRAAALKHAGLLDMRGAAREIGLSESRVLGLVSAGLLASQSVSYPGMVRPVRGIVPNEIARFLRRIAWELDSDDRRRGPWLDADRVTAHAEARGTVAREAARLRVTAEEIHEMIRDRVERRRRKLASRRKGRRPSRELHARWFERYRHHLAELEQERAGGRLSGNTSIETMALDATAREEWADHPEDWPRDKYPSATDGWDEPGRTAVLPARDRVRKGIKPLLDAWKK